MVILANWNGKPVTISSKQNSLTISLENKEKTSVYSFDKSGRMWTALVNGISYRRGLNGTIVAKWNSNNTLLERKWLSKSESDILLLSAHQTIRSLLDSFGSPSFYTDASIPLELKHEIENAAVQNLDFYQRDVLRYHQIYKPVGILPPDQYMSVVLQLTEGCSFNTCTFCTFYKDRPFRIKSLENFDSHISQIKEYLSESLNLRRTIFLGDANALVTPMQKLVPLLEIVHRHLEVEKLGGLFAFLDGFSGEKKSGSDYRILRDLGMEKIYIGLESGNDELLKFLNKPGKPADALTTVHEIKKAGISVAIIVLLGAGGRQFHDRHVQDTVQVLNQMELDANDILYFSELIESEGTEYALKAVQTQLEPLNSDERIQQGELISKSLIFSERGTPHISRYDIRDFVY
jgi:hypothetical protein